MNLDVQWGFSEIVDQFITRYCRPGRSSNESPGMSCYVRLCCELIPSCFMGLPLEEYWKREVKKVGERLGHLF
jgi:hypothetical protein